IWAGAAIRGIVGWTLRSPHFGRTSLNSACIPVLPRALVATRVSRRALILLHTRVLPCARGLVPCHAWILFLTHAGVLVLVQPRNRRLRMKCCASVLRRCRVADHRPRKATLWWC